MESICDKFVPALVAASSPLFSQRFGGVLVARQLRNVLFSVILTLTRLRDYKRRSVFTVSRELEARVDDR